MKVYLTRSNSLWTYAKEGDQLYYMKSDGHFSKVSGRVMAFGYDTVKKEKSNYIVDDMSYYKSDKKSPLLEKFNANTVDSTKIGSSESRSMSVSDINDWIKQLTVFHHDREEGFFLLKDEETGTVWSLKKEQLQ